MNLVIIIYLVVNSSIGRLFQLKVSNLFKPYIYSFSSSLWIIYNVFLQLCNTTWNMFNFCSLKVLEQFRNYYCPNNIKLFPHNFHNYVGFIYLYNFEIAI